MIDFPKNSNDQVNFVTVDPDYAGQRIDNFLLNILRGAPKSLIYRILRTGEVRVNKGRVKPAYRIQGGDVVRVPPVKLEEKRQAQPSIKVLQQLERSVIFEDDGLLIINKPSGIAVHGGSGINYGVIEGMRELRKEDHGQLELVHRLDRDTSGALILAKRRSALRRMHELMREGKIDKYYMALCAGKWKGSGKRIEAPLKKNTLSSGERIVRVSSDGKEACSIFRVKQRFAMATLMEVELLTGRTHQIRVHATHAGHPLAGDDKYGDKQFSQQMREYGLKRLFLHAKRLRFPWKDGTLDITAEPDEALVGVLDRLPK